MIKFSARNIEEVRALLEGLPRGAKIVAMREFSNYVIGDETHGLKYAPKQVKHGESNPYHWQTDEQRKAFFATKGFGRGIPTVRTGETVDAWEIKEQDSNWTMVKITNKSKGAPFVQGEWQQRGHKADGWRKYADILKSNMAGAMRAARKAVKDYIQSRS